MRLPSPSTAFAPASHQHARPYFDVTSPQDWLTTDAFARLRCVGRRRAQQVLAEWQREREAGKSVPRVQLVTGGRGRPQLHVLVADVAQLYALSPEDLVA